MPPSNSFAALNQDQARAAQFGTDGGPLLIIAGAGSGKTQTLAHRVAHLIEESAHPGRILLLTFSRRAAREMERRVERILTGRGMSQGMAAFGWSGTFHAVGARLLRDFAHSIGLNPAFTIHDREDSADLLNLVPCGFHRGEPADRAADTRVELRPDTGGRRVQANHPLRQHLERLYQHPFATIHDGCVVRKGDP